MNSKEEVTTSKNKFQVPKSPNLVESFLNEQFKKLMTPDAWGLNSRIKRTFTRP